MQPPRLFERARVTCLLLEGHKHLCERARALLCVPRVRRGVVRVCARACPVRRSAYACVWLTPTIIYLCRIMGDASWLCSSPSQPPGNLVPGAGTGLPFSKQSKKKANLQLRATAVLTLLAWRRGAADRTQGAAGGGAEHARRGQHAVKHAARARGGATRPAASRTHSLLAAWAFSGASRPWPRR